MKIIKISKTKQQNINVSYIKKIQDYFAQKEYGLRLKVLARDIFDSTINRGGWFDYIGKPRKLPNFITAPEDCVNVVFKQIKYFPEDVKKMKNMDVDTRIAYKQKLMSEGKYILPDDVNYESIKNN